MANQDRLFIKHSLAIYDMLLKLAKVIGPEEIQFTGSLTKVFYLADVPIAYYSKVRRVLIESGSITFIQRGSRYQETVISLHHEPPSNESALAEISSLGDLTGGANLATLVTEQGAAIQRLEAWRESLGGINIAEVFKDMERRLNNLEVQVGQREADNTDAEDSQG